MKNIKTIIITFVLLLCSLVIGGLIRYNFILNEYLNQEITDGSKIRIRSNSNRTEVHIVGTVHFETDTIKRTHLYNLIDHISPSIILFESDSNTVKRILKRRDYFFQLLNVFRNRAATEMEKAVVLKYIQNHPDCVVLPYEWEIRNQYHHNHKILSKPQIMYNSIIKLYRDSLLTKDQSITIEKFSDLNNSLNKIGKHGGTLTDINSFVTDSIVQQRQFYLYKNIPAIVKERKDLSEFLDFALVYENYWDSRNKAMVQNILKQIKRNPNKVIVVLNGFYHRYFLLNELKKYETEYNFTLQEV